MSEKSLIEAILQLSIEKAPEMRWRHERRHYQQNFVNKKKICEKNGHATNSAKKGILQKTRNQNGLYIL